MKRLLIVAVALAAFAACDIGFVYHTDLIPPLGLETVQEVMTFVAERVDYHSDKDMHDKLDEWQLPHQTYVWRSGDCEDHAVLAVYLLKHEIGVEAYGVIGMNAQEGHMWVVIDGVHWESIGGFVSDTLPERYPLGGRLWSYDELMHTANVRAITGGSEI